MGREMYARGAYVGYVDLRGTVQAAIVGSGHGAEYRVGIGPEEGIDPKVVCLDPTWYGKQASGPRVGLLMAVGDGRAQRLPQEWTRRTHHALGWLSLLALVLVLAGPDGSTRVIAHLPWTRFSLPSRVPRTFVAPLRPVTSEGEPS